MTMAQILDSIENPNIRRAVVHGALGTREEFEDLLSEIRRQTFLAQLERRCEMLASLSTH